MGFSHKSHGKRLDKETQSPMLKIFKDMMQKEKRDPEKTNLLKDKRVDKKRKHYSGSRSKSGHKTLSSSSEHHIREQPYKVEDPETRTAEYDAYRSRSLPFQSEKRDSWWFWGDTDAKSRAEDTCSCVSCALKKLISTDYACIACLVVLFTISVVIAIMLVYKSVPCMTSDTKKVPAIKIDYERLKRKSDRGKWNMKKSLANAFTRSKDPAFGSFKFQDMSSLVDSESDLSRLLDSDKMSDIQSSDRLREFYRKLIQTDAAIRNLRKNLNDNSFMNTDFEFPNNIELNRDVGTNIDVNSNANVNSNFDVNSDADVNSYPDRIKRSIQFLHRPMRLFHLKRNDHTVKSKIDKGKVVTKTTINMTTNKKPNKSSRRKRYGNSNDTEGIVIEKNKVVIQYNPNLSRIVPKCSHTPNDLKSHETQMKHPFYKNTQRLDELLDQFIDGKLPELLSDRLDDDMVIEKNKKCKHLMNEDEVSAKDDEQNSARDKDDQKILKELEDKEESKAESKQIVKTETNAFENEFFDDSDGVDKNIDRSSTSSYDILLSISTLLNPTVEKTSAYPASVLDDRMPNLRKLMQVDMKEDEGVAYEDLKEVLADDKIDHDENEKESNRKKRNDEPQVNTPDPALARTLPGINNPNWKGPMPLYPEELSQMMKEPDNKVGIPVHNRDSAPEADDWQPGLTDVEYVEDYLDNGYEKLVKLAQAYSDYGVLEEKKDDNEKKVDDKGAHKVEDRRVKLSMDGFKSGFKNSLRKSGIFERLKKGTDVSEGIRIEFPPTSPSREDSSPIDFYKIFQKHVKISSGQYKPMEKLHKENSFTPTLFPTKLHDIHIPYTPKLSDVDKTKTSKSYEPINNVFTVNKKRTLKSFDFHNELEDLNDDTTEVADKNVPSVEFVPSKFKREVNSSLGNETKEVNENKAVDDIKIDAITFKRKAATKSRVNEDTTQKTKSLAKENNMTISDFFMLLSNWFNALDGSQSTTRKSNIQSVVPRGKSVVVDKRNNEPGVTELALPIYDADMIDNIGHRSRVLLSVDDNNNTIADDSVKPEDDAEGKNEEVASSTESLKSINNTDAKYGTTKLMNSEDTRENNTRNRIVKRQAIEDSNLIFWNDLYDDEYGMQNEPLESNIRDKHSINKNDFMKKSNTWFQDKVKKITNRLNIGNFKGDGKRISREANVDGKINVRRNAVDAVDDESANTGKIDFAALTEKMKEICKNTVKAVQQTKNIQVREDNNKDSPAATSLMQQLVRLMTDLVDYQVQERTCRKLPPDLQNFLEWLTASKNEDEPYTSDMKEAVHPNFPNFNFDKSTEQDLFQLSEKENTDSRTDCLGTLHAVQDLIRQYEDMSDDDKSVMTGVKDYLENQMNFLQKQLTAIDDSKMYNHDASRFRRDLITDVGHTVAEVVDVTAKTVEHEYKNLKKMYSKYMNKLKQQKQKAAKATASMKEAVTEVAKKIEKVTKLPKHEHKKPNKEKTKLKDKKLKDDIESVANKVLKEQSNEQHHHHHLKEKFHLKDKVHLKDKTHSKDKVHLKDKTQLKDRDQVKESDHKIDNEENSEDFIVQNEEDHAARNKDGRNIKDVYFKAVEEAKKASTLKSAHKRGSDIFDKTEILRINE